MHIQRVALWRYVGHAVVVHGKVQAAGGDDAALVLQRRAPHRKACRGGQGPLHLRLLSCGQAVRQIGPTGAGHRIGPAGGQWLWWRGLRSRHTRAPQRKASQKSPPSQSAVAVE